MKYQQCTMHLFAEADNEQAHGYRLVLVPEQLRFWMDSDAVRLGEVTCLYDPPDGITPDLLRIRAIETLREKQKNVLAEAQQRVNELQTKIDKLLLLTHVKEVV